MLSEISKAHSHPQAAALAAQMGAVAPALLDQIHRSMEIDTAGLNRSTPRCIPYVAGLRECGMLPNAPSNRDSGVERLLAVLVQSAKLLACSHA